MNLRPVKTVHVDGRWSIVTNGVRYVITDNPASVHPRDDFHRGCYLTLLDAQGALLRTIKQLGR